MRKHLEFPTVGEGFNELHIIHESSPYDLSRQQFVSLIQGHPTYEELFQTLQAVPLFKEIYQFDQENPFHQFYYVSIRILCTRISMSTTQKAIN